MRPSIERKYSNVYSIVLHITFFRALTEAMQTVQHTKHFAHPANWAGFLLIGLNVRLSNKVKDYV